MKHGELTMKNTVLNIQTNPEVKWISDVNESSSIFRSIVNIMFYMNIEWMLMNTKPSKMVI